MKVLGNLVSPILSCMKESEAKVRFMACESMYNLVKVLRDVALVQFNEIFDGLIKVVADTDDEVKKAAAALDRLLKDVVTEAASERYQLVLALLSHSLTLRILIANTLI